MTFEELGLDPNTLKAIHEMGYTSPTPIQEQAIPLVLMARDVMGIAQTGTGKTASFTLPMIDILANGRAKARMPRSLILAPTRELAAQVAENFEQYGKYQNLSMALLIGGESFTDQERALDRGVDVLIATPGRLIDLFERGRILMSDVKVLVIDEADRMLDMGFIPDVERILSWLPPLRQTLLFSATMAPEIKKLADKFLSNPKTVSVAPQASPAESVKQFMAVVGSRQKRETLRALLKGEDVTNAFIFCNRKRDVSVLYRSLQRHEFSAGQLHGDMPQSTRTETLEAFRSGEIKLLVCSDVAARGLDIADVSHVFNYDVPTHAEDYIHRIGRTGRAGREGRAWTIATPQDTKHVTAISELIGKPLEASSVAGEDPLPFEDEDAKKAKRGRKPKPEKQDKTGRSKSTKPHSSGKDPKPTQADAISQDPVEVIQELAANIAVVANEADSTAKPANRGRGRTPSRDANTRDTAHGRRNNRRGRSNQPADDVAEMDHADDVLAFGDHTPNFVLFDPLAK